MTNKEAIKWLGIELEQWEEDCKSIHPTKEALRMAIEALEKMDNYNKMAEHLAKLGFVCEQMPLHQWCNANCNEDKPDIECVEMWLKWSSKE